MENPTAIIPLWYRGQQQPTGALISASDFESLSSYRWHLAANGYACRHIAVRIGGRIRTRAILMHRQILGLEAGDGRQGDHINRNRIDNRRENLRIVSGQAEQAQNRTPQRGSSSRFLGVSRRRGHRKWRAEVCYQGHRWDLGYFETEEAAALAASRKRLELMPYAVEGTAS